MWVAQIEDHGGLGVTAWSAIGSMIAVVIAAVAGAVAKLWQAASKARAAASASEAEALKLAQEFEARRNEDSLDRYGKTNQEYRKVIQLYDKRIERLEERESGRDKEIEEMHRHHQECLQENARLGERVRNTENSLMVCIHAMRRANIPVPVPTVDDQKGD